MAADRSVSGGVSVSNAKAFIEKVAAADRSVGSVSDETFTILAMDSTGISLLRCTVCGTKWHTGRCGDPDTCPECLRIEAVADRVIQKLRSAGVIPGGS